MIFSYVKSKPELIEEYTKLVNQTQLALEDIPENQHATTTWNHSIILFFHCFMDFFTGVQFVNLVKK